MTDGDGVIVLVNREIERLFGYAREELLGKPIEVLVPERLRGDHPGSRAGFMSEPRVRPMGRGRDLYGRCKGGAEVPVEIGLTPIATAEGIFVIASVVDISARKREEARLQAVIESAPSGMVMIDRRGRIALVNREVERLFGYDRAELLGQPIEALVPERGRAGHVALRDGYFADPQVRAMGVGRDLFGVRKDGSEIPVEIRLNPIANDEGPFVLASIVDISARRRADEERRGLEEQLRQAQKMEALGRLAGGIAHDFNNLLGAIVGYAELAREAAAPGGVADLDELLRAAERGRGLVDRILSFSRRQDVQLRPIDLGPAVEEVVRLLRATLPAFIPIHYERPAAPLRVLGDPTAIHQVLMNLANNAAHAMPHGGALGIALSPFQVTEAVARLRPGLREGPHARLEVRDTGHGMDEETLARAFEPFFTTKPPGDGSGLGLAMVHGIVRGHGGAVWIESEVGRGTRVTCLLPAVPGEVEAPADDPPPPPTGARQRVLLVDDEEALLAVGRRRLERLGYVVDTAVGPDEALALLEVGAAYDLVITDYSMPRMSGVELTRAILRIRPGTPILMWTGYASFDVVDATDAGVRAILAKPATLQSLAEAVQRALAGA